MTSERTATDAPATGSADVLPSRRESPALVLRPQLQWRIAGPALLVLAVLVLAAGRLRALPIAFVLGLAGLAFLPAWRERLEVGPTTIHQRTLRHEHTVDISTLDTMGLRRVPFALLRWLPRGYKFGRFWSIPLTLRLLHGDDVLLEIRCAWWSDWRELTRFVIAAYADVELDGRTRGRLERYVGVLTTTPSQR